jgi:hypothetical protein
MDGLGGDFGMNGPKRLRIIYIGKSAYWIWIVRAIRSNRVWIVRAIKPNR